MKERQYIQDFNFNINVLSKSDKKFLKTFCTGTNYPEKAIGEYLYSDEVFSDMETGDAVTYLVTHTDNTKEKEIVAYFSLAASSLPYYFRDVDDEGNGYTTDILCGISAIKITMFGVDVKYQNVFYKEGNEDKPIAAWIFEAIIGIIDEMARNTMGIKAIYLHTLPRVKAFYCRNYMKPAGDYFHPLAECDDDLEVLYILIRKVQGLDQK